MSGRDARRAKRTPRALRPYLRALSREMTAWKRIGELLGKYRTGTPNVFWQWGKK